ncbi:ubiquinol-cytochrome c reductase iron-sulfur subunit [Allomeiothermus silvanus]|uniref:QcrA and Rieske domain-containing protein n=1 Tax=Allomeiothermus silvanus TaxID=52022 RepID=UPI0023F361B6|nr:Rieske 2Fe-2S domain-containing protein [Allomeiothermus silvanus]
MKLTRRDLIWIVPSTATAGFFGWFALRAYNIQLRKAGVGVPQWKEGPRLEVARVFALAHPWDFRYFKYPVAIGSTTRQLEAVLVRVPQPQVGGLTVGETHFLALSRICTHQGCTVRYVPDPEVGSIAYNYRSDHPFLGCPCHFGAYDPLQAGKAVYGPPRYPLPRLRLAEEAGMLYVTGYETPLRPAEGG